MMAPSPQELPLRHGSKERLRSATLDDDGKRVVISGVSGAYPKALHIKQLSENLYNKVHPIADKDARWDYEHPEVPQYVGLMPGLSNFDAQFFRVHYHLGVTMDPMSRKILEHTYQAIFDAGVNPGSLSGKKIGVYIGSCLSEAEKAAFYTDVGGKTGLGIAGCNKSMFANRVSYWLNAKGPSLSIDAACCSSMVALEQAYQAMTRGDCEAAVIGGCNVCLHPQTSIHFGRNIQLCKDGKTKSYDQGADGCVRSEAVNVLFLQKAKDALRIYADVVNVKTKYVSLKSSGSFKREPEEITGFLNEFYGEVPISPKDVEYVEGFGAADFEADKLELEAIDKVFCSGRTEPLYVGSVMSNLGYCESASGIAGITKVLLGYHTGQLAGNLHCENPREDVAALRDGRIRILTDHKPITRNFIAVNGLSITGVNSHVLLHGHYKPKDLGKYQCNIPRLVLLSGRTDQSVQNVINHLKSHPIDAEELALIQNVHSSKINGHLGRGFTILDTDSELKTIALAEKAEYFDSADRPLWFVYSGMGSQWATMGVQLMRLPIFAAAIERCRRVLEPKGIDIIHIITSPDKTIYDNILHSFVGIAACQIGLTDVLFDLGLVPDKIIGHSVGELGCAYADGCMTAEEMILSAYSRGLVSIQTPFIRGSMAAVGIGFNEVSKMCPPEIEVACHNSPNSSTISGPAEVMAEFVAQLTAKGIFAKEVPCSNIAYHSRYIAEAGPGLLHYLKVVLKTPKLRSERWVSTSVPVDNWNQESAKYSSAEYHTNNLLNPVLFEETARMIPNNAVLVEVAPHGLLQAILRRSHPSCVHVPLTRRGHEDNARFLLEAIGKLYMEGYYPDIRVLYPKVEFPVSTGTPHLSHLVGWAHQEKWFLAQYENPERKSTAICTYKISLHDEEYNYLQGHQIGGRTLFPFASALVAVWDTLSMTQGAPRRRRPVQFRDVQLFAQPVLHDSRLLRLCVCLHRGTGWFEINDDVTKVASGYVVLKRNNVKFNAEVENSTEGTKFEKEEIYQILNERGHTYRQEFRSISETNTGFTEAVVPWTGNWAVCLDALMQLHTLRLSHHGLSQPVFIRQLDINTETHMNLTELDTSLKVKVCEVQDSTRCSGITLKGLRFRNISKPEVDSLVLKIDPRYQVGNTLIKKTVNDHSQNGKVLQSTIVGDLESLQWIDASVPKSAGITVKVHFAGLNASDVMKANGDIPFEDKLYASESYYGMDYSGTTANGQRVMGVVRGGAVSSFVRAEPSLLWPVPAHWSLEDAATVPLPYAHALYFLGIKTGLLSRSKVLVSGGAGATGQAVISLALHLNCRVFVVVRDMLKKPFLIKMFPKLNADDIICCRDGAFEDRILSATKGLGCEYVICGRGDTKDAYLRCCSGFGYTLDIHQVKGNEDFAFKMHSLSMERGYFRVDFAGIFENIGILKKLQSLVAEGISSGAIRPLSRVCYAPHDAARAFRLLAASQHRGRVLIKMPHTFQLTVEPMIVCSGERSQLIISDDEALAVHLATRLVQRGARALHLQIAQTSARFSLAHESWRKLGVNVVRSSEKLTNASVPILLKRTSQLGSVEGIFIMITKSLTDQTRKHDKSLVANLDTEARKQCPHLKFFTVVGVNNSVGEHTCISRAGNQFPAMMLSVVTDTKVEDGTTEFSAGYSNIVNAVEKGLQTMQPVIVAQHSSVLRASLSEQIAKIAGIEISESTAKTKTLQDLGITLNKAQMVSLFLKDKQNVWIGKDEIPLLTIERIREIETTLKESDYVPAQGLKAIFPYVYSDELMATVDSVIVPTLTISSDMRDDEFSSETCLYIIPGLQGLHQPYQRLCERLQLAAIVLQPGLDHPRESIQETTERYAKTFLKRNSETNKFYLLGHEFGIIHVLELAAVLEDHGLTGTVFCLGGGPDEFLNELERQLETACAGAVDEEVLQEAVARHMCALMSVASPQLNATLHDAATWQEKVEASVNALRGRVAHSTQYARLLIEAAFARVTQARRHRQVAGAPRALRSRVVLLCSPPAPAPATATAHSPHPLQRYSQLPLAVHDLRAPLASAADDLRVAAVVNQYLDEETKDEFASKNLCHTYLMNIESFIHNPNVDEISNFRNQKKRS